MSVFKKLQKQKAQEAADKRLLELAKKQMGKDSLTPEEEKQALQAIKNGSKAMQLAGILKNQGLEDEVIIEKVMQQYELPEEMVRNMVTNPQAFAEPLR